MREWAKHVALKQGCFDAACTSVLDRYHINLIQTVRGDGFVLRDVSKLRRCICSPSPRLLPPIPF